MKLKYSILLAFIFIAGVAFSQEHKTEDSQERIEEFEKKEHFNPGEFIIDEVLDHYEWHITEIDGKEISIPLPIIVYSKERHQWFVFCSTKVRHGKHYKGFFIPEEGKYKAKL
jgi:F-type H+-transporting ATPase subunit a